MEKHYTTREVSRILGVTLGTLRVWRSTGKGPSYVKFGDRVVRYPESKLEEWIDEKTGNA